MFFLTINFSFQNFSIKQFPLPLPSQKITPQVIFCDKFILRLLSASVAQLVRAADL